MHRIDTNVLVPNLKPREREAPRWINAVCSISVAKPALVSPEGMILGYTTFNGLHEAQRTFWTVTVTLIFGSSRACVAPIGTPGSNSSRDAANASAIGCYNSDA